MAGEYETGVLECFSDFGVCLYGCFCPPCLMGQNWARSRSEDCNIWHCCAVEHPMWTRINVRKMLGATENSYCGDCCIYCICPSCAVCQDARQLDRINKN